MSRPRQGVRTCCLVVVVAATGCASSHATSHGSTGTFAGDARAELAHVDEITALGDSVPYGAACGCTPYPELVASDIGRAVGHAVSTDNDAVPGYTTDDVLDQLHHASDVAGDIEHSQAVLVEIGANDVGHNPTCGTRLACYQQELPAVTRNLVLIVDRIHQIAGSRPVPIVLLDYWSVWLGGKYARAQGAAYVATADALTVELNTSIRLTAHSAAATYVDLRTAFRGPDGMRDETALLASDGDHPNAAGHRRIAEAVAMAIAR